MTAPQRIGRYVVERLLGHGGMGEVYLARDEVLERKVALKVLRPTEGPERALAVKRVLREARMAAALDHPNVVALFDFGEEDGTPFIVMEYVDGRSLRTELESGASPGERLRWLVDVARALSAAHRANLVHRDVKPENVMVRQDGVVKVLDFGIAQRAAAAAPGSAFPRAMTPGLTGGATENAGTPGYMAPEQIAYGDSDARCDQFAWGVLAYEVLSGALPWRGTEASEIFEEVLRAEPAPLDTAALGLPAEVGAVVARALEKDPSRRFGSMADLCAALNVGDEVASRRGGARAPSVDPQAPTLQATVAKSAIASARRERKRPWAVGVVLGVVAGAAVLVGLRALRPDPPPTTREAARPEASAAPLQPRASRRLTLDEGCEEYPSFTADGKQVVFDAQDGSDFHVYAVDAASGARRALTTGPGWQYAAQLSPDGVHVAYLRFDQGRGGAYVARLEGSEPERRIAEGNARPAFSPDGKALWAGRSEAPTRFDLATLSATRTLTVAHDQQVRVMVELPDGRIVARLALADGPILGVKLFGAAGDDLGWLVEGEVQDFMSVTPDGGSMLVATRVRGGDELWRLPLDRSAPALMPWTPVPVRGIAFSRTADRVVWSSCGPRSDLAKLVPAGADRLEALRLGPADQPLRDWTEEEPTGVPRSRTMVLVSDRDGEKGRLWVVDLDGRSPARKLPFDGGDPYQPRVSPDGRSVVFAVHGKGLFVAPLDGGAARRLTDVAGDTTPAFAHDGASVVFARLEAGRSDVSVVPAGGGNVRRVVAGRDPEPSPVRDEIAYRDEGGGARLLEVGTGKSRPLVDAPLIGGRFAFAPDGARIVVANSQALVEIDARERRVTRRYDPKATSITGATFVGADLVVSRQIWDGDVWIADGDFR